MPRASLDTISWKAENVTPDAQTDFITALTECLAFDHTNGSYLYPRIVRMLYGQKFVSEAALKDYAGMATTIMSNFKQYANELKASLRAADTQQRIIDSDGSAWTSASFRLRKSGEEVAKAIRKVYRQGLARKEQGNGAGFMVSSIACWNWAYSFGAPIMTEVESQSEIFDTLSQRQSSDASGEILSNTSSRSSRLVREMEKLSI